MPAWLIPALMFGGPIIQQVVGLFHKDDPKNPTMDVGQAPSMILQNLMPMIMMMSMMGKDDSKTDSLLPMMLMMQMMGVNPTQVSQGATTNYQQALINYEQMKKDMDAMRAMIEAMTGKPLAESPN